VLENAALREAAFGNSSAAKQSAAEGLKLFPNSVAVQVEAALALAMSGDATGSEALMKRLDSDFPLNTQVQLLWLTPTRAKLSLNRADPAAALKELEAAKAVEFGNPTFALNISCLYPAYMRGEAYLASGQGAAAAAEFQKILDHSGMVWNCWTGALARLGVARAKALQARTSQGAEAKDARLRAIAAYENFLTLWHDADSGIPILKQAKAEYADLKSK